MSESLGQTVVVENRPGAGGNIGLAYAAKAALDGYTIYMAAVSNVAIAAAAYSAQPVHLVKDFVPVAGVATVPHMLVVPASLSVQNVSQLVSYFKASPGKYNFASQGAGMLPDVPAVDKSGVNGFDTNNLFGVSAPKGTPAAIIATLSKAIQSALNSPELKQRMQDQGVELNSHPLTSSAAWSNRNSVPGAKP